MCRICGRTIKCIFDNMPSRTLTHHIPSRRAFTTLRQTRPQSLPSRSPAPTPSLTRALSTLSLSPAAHTRPSTGSLLTRTTRTSLLAFPTRTPSSIISTTSTRTFSTTPAVLGHRRRMDTFSPSRRVQKRRHGYLARLRSKTGRKTLKNRALRGRKALSW